MTVAGSAIAEPTRPKNHGYSVDGGVAFWTLTLPGAGGRRAERLTGSSFDAEHRGIAESGTDPVCKRQLAQRPARASSVVGSTPVSLAA